MAEISHVGRGSAGSGSDSRVWQAIMKLEEPYKDVFILHAYGEVKLKEIALSYGRTESWARVTYYRAKQQIVKEISQ